MQQRRQSQDQYEAEPRVGAGGLGGGGSTSVLDDNPQEDNEGKRKKKKGSSAKKQGDGNGFPPTVLSRTSLPSQQWAL